MAVLTLESHWIGLTPCARSPGCKILAKLSGADFRIDMYRFVLQIWLGDSVWSSAVKLQSLIHLLNFNVLNHVIYT